MSATLNPNAPHYYPYLGFVPETTNPNRIGWTGNESTATRLEYRVGEPSRHPGFGYTSTVSNALNRNTRPMASAGAAAVAGIGGAAIGGIGQIIDSSLSFETARLDRQLRAKLEGRQLDLTEKSLNNDFFISNKSIDVSKDLDQQRINNAFYLGKQGLDIDRMNANANQWNALTAQNYQQMEQNQLDKRWEAARSMGLYSIDQLGSQNTSIYRTSGYSPSFSRIQRTSGNSPFGMTF